jgi:hypothetical protein
MAEPVLVYTGTKPPLPGTYQAGWKVSKPKVAKKTAAKAKDADDSKPAAGNDKEAVKPKAAKNNNAAKPIAATGSSAESQPAKPKPKKPAPKNAPTALTPPAQQNTQAR